MSNKNKLELAVNAGLQAIPFVGGSLATLYFGYKQEQRLCRIEQTLKEIAEELQDVQLPGLEKHNKEELVSLIDEVTDKIENEHFETKRILYKEYFKNLLKTPTNGNYDERKLFLDILDRLTPLQIELFHHILKKPNVLDVDLQNMDFGLDSSIIRGSILQLENYGLITSSILSITLGSNNSSMPKMLNCSNFGKKFNEFCLTDM